MIAITEIVHRQIDRNEHSAGHARKSWKACTTTHLVSSLTIPISSAKAECRPLAIPDRIQDGSTATALPRPRFSFPED
jgi:hypothetical protein